MSEEYKKIAEFITDNIIFAQKKFLRVMKLQNTAVFQKATFTNLR